MTELEQLIANAFETEGNQDAINKAYLVMLKTLLFIPTQKDFDGTEEQPFMPLIVKAQDRYFMLVFDTLEKLQIWADSEFDKMTYVKLPGREIIKAIGENVFLGLNYGSPIYKEFSPDEILHLKKIVAKVEKLTGAPH